MRVKPSYILICFLLSAIWNGAFGQMVRFNEVITSNSVFTDEDGDTPDGFELYNYGEQEASVFGWTLTDDLTEPLKWTLAKDKLAPHELLWIWASGKDKPIATTYRTLINEGDVFKYIVPQSEIRNWRSTEFNDAAWESGKTGIGFGDQDDATQLEQGNFVVYLRKTFTIQDMASVQSLILHIDYDDAFVAYINGKEIARSNIYGDFPAYNVYAQSNHEALMYQGEAPEKYVIENPLDVLQNGKNVLSIQVHNVSRSSSDLSAIPFLTAGFEIPLEVGIVPPAILNIKQPYLHTNFKISAAGETLYLFDLNQHLVDSIQVPSLPANTSYGVPKDGNSHTIFEKPTPDTPNPDMGYSGKVLSSVTYSHQGGTVSPLSLQLSGNKADEIIRYTLDASIPDSTSIFYTRNIIINKSSVVRARIFKTGYLPSETESRTFLVNTTHELPVVTLTTEAGNFFDPDTGMYVIEDGYVGDYPYFGSNIWKDWERPVHFAYYEQDGSFGTAFNGGAKLFGAWSKANDQRSLAIFARSTYGPPNIQYPLFKNLPYTSYESIVLRNSGNDWMSTMLRDAALTSLMEGSGLDYTSYQPVVTYINGQYWGFYNMREKINEHFLAARHNVNSSKIDLLEAEGNVVQGDSLEYMELIKFVSGNDLKFESNYRYVADRIDVDNFIIYQIAEIYFNNTDWPGNNIKFWKTNGRKWQWILYDTDFGFGIWNTEDYYNNTLAFAMDAHGKDWPNPPWSTLLLRKLLENSEFKQKFVNRFADELNTRFLGSNVIAHITKLANVISAEIPDHYQRWQRNVNDWSNNVNGMKTFAELRPEQVRKHIRAQFDFTAERTVTLQNPNPEQGYIKLNYISIKENSWSGKYYLEIPIHLTAIAEPGYRFSHWTGRSNSTEDSLTVVLSSNMTYQANFVPTDIENVPLVINEINYNSSDTIPTGDWVEIYNPNSTPVNLSNWILKDGDSMHKFIIPEGTVIDGNGYYVFARDRFFFEYFHPELKHVIGSFGFGLGTANDCVRLFNAGMKLQDSVAYTSVAPWPLEANGYGFTLELKKPSLDNEIAENWASIHFQGSPGKQNYTETEVHDLPSDPSFAGLYPNPATQNGTVYVSQGKISGTVTLYALDGIRLAELQHKQHAISLDGIASGMYILSYSNENDEIVTVRLIVQ